MRTYLSRLGVLTHKGLVRAGQLRRELVDVQDLDGDGHPAGQDRTVWEREREFFLSSEFIMIQLNHDRPHVMELYDSSELLLVTHRLRVSTKLLFMKKKLQELRFC